MRLVVDDMRCRMPLGRPDELYRRVGTLGFLLKLAEEVVGLVGAQLAIRHDTVEVFLHKSSCTGTGPTCPGLRLVRAGQWVHLVRTVIFSQL